MTRTIAVYGGSFNPPGAHHRRIVEALRQQFDEVVVVPCGPRPDKPAASEIAPVYRAALADIAFKGIAGVEVDLFDLEQATFTRTHDLDSRYADRGEVWHVVGSDLITGGGDGCSFIQRVWQGGTDVWRALNFAVLRRPGHEFGPADLPPRHRLVSVEAEGSDGSSATIRDHLYRGEGLAGMVTPDVGDFIARHGLFRPTLPNRATRCRLDRPRLKLCYDGRNARAAAWAEQFKPYESPDDPNCVLVLGGDGSMLHAIQSHWRLRVPFFGVNAGHLGFLLNKPEEVLGGRFPPPQLIARHMPLLYVEMQLADGSWTDGLTFNDAWVERSTGQTAWVEVKVDGQARLPKLVCDGVLLSTAAGSTAYARSMGATPLLVDTPAWLMVGSNVMQPLHWKSALLSLESSVEMRNLDPGKRPLNGYLYGILLGEVLAMRARVSRIAAVELAFCPQHDLTEKIAQIQFPRVDWSGEAI